MNEYDEIATFYDEEHAQFTDDVDFYTNIIREGPVLEVGAGTGRILEPLARAGLEVWGVEPSTGMLERAQARLAGVSGAHVVRASAETFLLDREFSTAVIGLNTLWHAVTTEAQLSMLRRVRDHLAPSGFLIVDTSNPLSMADRDAAGEVRQVFRSRVGEDMLTRYTASWDDPGAQTLRVSISYQVTRADGTLTCRETSLLLRYLYRYEAELLLRVAGFEVLQVYGSYDLEPYGTDSPRILLTARARA